MWYQFKAWNVPYHTSPHRVCIRHRTWYSVLMNTVLGSQLIQVVQLQEGLHYAVTTEPTLPTYIRTDIIQFL